MLHGAAELLDDTLYAAADDLKDFFNQLKLSPQELWKQKLVWLDLMPISEIAEHYASS